jgi:iron-sulfur cluster repair protein YtfE (RIC family)
MNAIELLKQDHQYFRQILEKLGQTTERAVKTRRELLHRLKAELDVHTDMEEEIFYPAFKKAGEKAEAVMIYEGREEHRTVDALVIPDLLKTDPGSVPFSGRVKVLKELIEHHLEEEEKEMFPKAAKLLGKVRLEELGQQMEERRRQLKQSQAA